MKTTKITTTIPTYNSGDGHGNPEVPVAIEVGQGITVTMLNGFKPDIYIERLPGCITVNITPDGTDVRVVVKINDDGSILIP